MNLSLQIDYRVVLREEDYKRLQASSIKHLMGSQ